MATLITEGDFRANPDAVWDKMLEGERFSFIDDAPQLAPPKNLTEIFEKCGFSDQSVLDGFVNLAREGYLWIRGDIALGITEHHRPGIRGYMFIPNDLTDELGFTFPHIIRDTRTALVKVESYKKVPDIDLLINLPLDSDPIKKLVEAADAIERVRVERHDNPQRISIGVPGQINIDLVHFGDDAAQHHEPCISLDKIIFPISKDLSICTEGWYDSRFFFDLEVWGFEKVKEHPTSKVSGRIALRFLLASVYQHNGRGVRINPDMSDPDEKIEFNFWLLGALTHIITNRDATPDSNSLSPYEKLLAIVQPYWPILDKQLKGVILNAFRTAYAVEKAKERALKQFPPDLAGITLQGATFKGGGDTSKL